MKTSKTIIALAALLVASCGEPKNIEKKAEKLLSEHTKSQMIYPKSYELVSLNIDSAFAPNDLPGIMEVAEKVGKRALMLDSLSRLYHENVFDNEEEIIRARMLKDEAEDCLLAFYKKNSLEDIYKYGIRQFTGYKIVHQYVAEDDNHDKKVYEVLNYVDTDMTHVLASYDLNSDKYKYIKVGIELLDLE